MKTSGAEFLFFLILVYRPTIFRKSTFWRLFTWNCLKIVRTVCIYKVLIMDFLAANPLSFCYCSILKIKPLSPCLSFLIFHDGGRYHIETSPFICFAMDWFLYDNGPRHERVKCLPIFRSFSNICDRAFLRK